MLITLDNSSLIPLYRQIVDEIRGKILSSELKPGDPLPSIRQLAADLLISVITTKRAYQDLEAAGLIQTRPGRGAFISELSKGYLQKAGLQEVEDRLGEAVRTAVRLGIAAEVVESLLKRLLDSQSEIGSGGRDEAEVEHGSHGSDV